MATICIFVLSDNITHANGSLTLKRCQTRQILSKRFWYVLHYIKTSEIIIKIHTSYQSNKKVLHKSHFFKLQPLSSAYELTKLFCTVCFVGASGTRYLGVTPISEPDTVIFIWITRTGDDGCVLVARILTRDHSARLYTPNDS